MLKLLSLDQATLYILHWLKKGIPEPCAPDAMKNVLASEELRKEYFCMKIFLDNAILAGELPSLKKAKPKAQEKKLMKQAGVPEDVQDMIPKAYDIWITWEDLITFVERPAAVSDNSYAHSREALARVAWMLVNNAELDTESNPLQIALDEIVIDCKEKGIDCKLCESTLKSCVREILAAGDTVLGENS